MKYILNVGHKTVSGPELSAEFVKYSAGRYFPGVTQTVVASEYLGVPEQTSVLRFENNDSIADVWEKCAELSNVLDQECIAFAYYTKGAAFGGIVGANPSDIEFDFDYFRI